MSGETSRHQEGLPHVPRRRQRQARSARDKAHEVCFVLCTATAACSNEHGTLTFTAHQSAYHHTQDTVVFKCHLILWQPLPYFRARLSGIPTPVANLNHSIRAMYTRLLYFTVLVSALMKSIRCTVHV